MNSLPQDTKSVTLAASKSQSVWTMRNHSPKRRDPKKTVSIEVRVNEEEKHAFILACRSANHSASSVLRRLMGLFVSLQKLRHRTLEMMTRFFFNPVRAAITSIGAVAALSMGLLLAPTASADMQLAYQAVVDDGTGLLVSHGVAELRPHSDSGEAVSDRLGETVRYALQARSCEAGDAPACPADGAHVFLTLWDESAGATVTDRGIVLENSGEALVEMTLNDGRLFSVVFALQTSR
jgi:hypothetical protein